MVQHELVQDLSAGASAASEILHVPVGHRKFGDLPPYADRHREPIVGPKCRVVGEQFCQAYEEGCPHVHGAFLEGDRLYAPTFVNDSEERPDVVAEHVCSDLFGDGVESGRQFGILVAFTSTESAMQHADCFDVRQRGDKLRALHALFPTDSLVHDELPVGC